MNLIKNPDKSSPPTVILSGLTRGLGRALFEQLVAQAYPIVGLGRDLGRIEAVAKSASAPIGLIEVDFADDSKALEETLAALGRLLSATSTGPWVFISNASIIEPIGQAVGLTLSGLERAMRTNCLAPLTIANFLTKNARTQGFSLLIVNVSSGAANRPIRGWQAYCTTKAAYKMALDVLAAENLHVRVVHFDPGVMDTSMQELIRAQWVVDMPEVEVFRGYQEKGGLKAPQAAAAELISVMQRDLL